MLEQVELKIKELRKEQAQEYYKKKDSDLRAWGLLTKKDGKTVPLAVSDEEYDALIKASTGIGASGRSGIAFLLNVLSIGVLISSVILAFVIKNLSDNLGFVYFSLSIVAGVLFSALFRGVAEAVKLLQQLVDDKPIVIPGEYKRAEGDPNQPNVVDVQIPVQPQQTAVREQPIMYQQQVPVQAPVYHQPYQQPMYQQPAYQQPPYQQAPYQQPPYQAPYQQQYQPTYSAQPSFDDPFAEQANAPLQFDE